MDKFTVLIADDHPVFRKRLRALLASLPEVELVGEATSGMDAIRLAEQLQPDILFVFYHQSCRMRHDHTHCKEHAAAVLHAG